MRKLLAAHLLGSPFGGAGTALDGAHRAPAPLPAFFRRKLGKELHPPTARTCAGLLMSTSGASCPRRDLPGVQPPRTCASLLMSTSEASCHRRELPGVQPPRTCASLLMSTSGSELPWARIVPRGHAPRIARGATPAHVRYPFAQARRLAAAPWRE